MRLQKNCEICGRRLELVREHLLVDTIYKQYDTSGERIPTDLTNEVGTLKFYKCKHFFFTPTAPKFDTSILKLQSLDERKEARPYQIDGVAFGLEKGNVLIADQMGLGKTVQAELILRNKPTLMPCLTVVRGATVWQWLNTHKEWVDNAPLSCFIIRDSKSFIPPGFSNYIISMDTFSRLVTVEVSLKTSDSYYLDTNKLQKNKVTIDEKLLWLGIKTVIADECQSFKNQTAKRSLALVGFCQQQKIANLIALSGTPIKNRADEYFTILNLLAPDRFPTIEKFRRDWLTQDAKGKWSRVNPYLEEEFREEISDFVIRREVKDVMKDLPPFRRTFESIHVDDENLKKVYNAELEKLGQIADSKANITYWDVSDCLMTLRRITGMMKVDFTVDYVDTFIDTTDNEKIAIGVHHKAVRDALFYKLSERGLRPLKISGEDNSDDKERIKKEFQKTENRILIINMLAGGVGMDGLQVCNNVIGLERQWNSVDEEQFEARFWRSGQLLPVLCEYFQIYGTVDDFFSSMVEEKRYIFGKTVGNDWNLMQDPQMLRDLVEKTVRGRLA